MPAEGTHLGADVSLERERETPPFLPSPSKGQGQAELVRPVPEGCPTTQRPRQLFHGPPLLG